VAVEESEHGRFSVELAVAAGEGVVGDDAAPELAHEGRPHEARGVIGRMMSPTTSAVSSGGWRGCAMARGAGGLAAKRQRVWNFGWGATGGLGFGNVTGKPKEKHVAGAHAVAHGPVLYSLPWSFSSSFNNAHCLKKWCPKINWNASQANLVEFKLERVGKFKYTEC
jgi:hypothetical protein